MIEGRYSTEELVRIEAVCPQAADPHARRILEEAAREYLRQHSISTLTSQAAQQRARWKKIARKAEELRVLLDEADCWLPPIWWSPDRSQDDHKALAAAKQAVEGIAVHARGNEGDFDAHSRANGGTRNPAREELYSEVLRVWTDVLGRELRVSKDPNDVARGPLWRFFQAAVEPIMGESCPKATSFPDIVKRERERRGVLDRRKNSKTPSF